jgi:hypothetical protein
LPLSSNNATFGGFASQLSGSESGGTTITATTGVGAATINLSSAGFMVVRVGTPNITTGDTRGFLNAQYVAMPIFTIPESIIRLAQEVEKFVYPYSFSGYRVYFESANGPNGPWPNDITTGQVTGMACSGFNDWTRNAEEYDIYISTPSLSLGGKIAATVNSLSTDEIKTLSGWWSFSNTLYFVNSTNTITITGNC